MAFTPLIDELIEAFCCLPGVGQKSAQRMAFHLLERDRNGGMTLAQSLQQAMSQVGHCETCRTFSDIPICNICSNSKRDEQKLCIVESPADVLAIEQTASYRGRYFVLMGHLSPIDGIGPKEIGLDILANLLSQNEQVSELIVATNPTVEGEATAHYIAQMVKNKSIVVSRIAHGVPIGGELEFIDGGTLAHAFAGRRPITDSAEV